MTTISAQSILSSCNAVNTATRVDTLLLRYPRWIHAEGRTHRLIRIGEEEEIDWSPKTPSLMEDENLSRNASSSRAIPVARLIADVENDPAIPLWWGKNVAGMQAPEELSPGLKAAAIEWWKIAMDEAIKVAKKLQHLTEDEEGKPIGTHKQIVNRLLEPFSHITVVATATNWSNFLALRDHPDAEPHIHMLAREVRRVLDGAQTKILHPGEWHLPFVAPLDWKAAFRKVQGDVLGCFAAKKAELDLMLKLSVARCASTSYDTVEGYAMTIERAVALHDRLKTHIPPHASPFEHQCQADQAVGDGRQFDYWAHPEEHGNFTGFRQYRKTLPNECL